MQTLMGTVALFKQMVVMAQTTGESSVAEPEP